MRPTVEVSIRGSTATAGHYFTWSPVDCTARVTDPDGAVDPVAITVRNRTHTAGAPLTFRAAAAEAPADQLPLLLDVAGAPTSFQIVPVFQSASEENHSAGIVVDVAGEVDASVEISAMVRIRPDADTMTTAQRDRYLTAFAALNDGGAGRFQDFRDMHLDSTSDEAHGNAGFLPWHRAYLLDLERELQAIDPSVTLPYWRFDRPAPNLFSPHFIGQSTGTSQPELAPSNPLATWVTDGIPGIQRRTTGWNDQKESAPGLPTFPVRTEAETLALGSVFQQFWVMEGSPHGAAHISFVGSINSIDSAARDPLFFMLHCNVDRLWAKWQWLNRRYDGGDSATYHPDGAFGAVRVGHKRGDTMWPWNAVTGWPRPPTAPRTPLAPSPVTAAPGDYPTVGAMIDYQGQLSPDNWCGFDYDDVPFEPEPGGTDGP
ncbi:MAG: tyrosinase family protein [Actinomycetota bacterium]